MRSGLIAKRVKSSPPREALSLEWQNNPTPHPKKASLFQGK